MSLVLAPPRPISRMRALLARLTARLSGRWEVRLDNRALVKVLFDETFYLTRHQIRLKAGQRALDHYLTEGWRAGLSPHPMIDTDWYASRRPDAAPVVFDLLAYLSSPARFLDPVHPLFDAAGYLERNAEVEVAGVNPLAHYLAVGWREGREPNALFHSAWYLAENLDVLEGGMNPLAHYVRFGSSEGRPPHPLFDRAYYLRRYSDVAAAGMDDYTHFIAIGWLEGRSPEPLVDEIARALGLNSRAVAATLSLPGAAMPDNGAVWPPTPRTAYVLPDTLRRFIGATYSPTQAPLYRYLMSVIADFEDRPDAFADSPELEALVDRARALSTAKAANGNDPLVSIILPVANNLLYTLTAVVSVLEAADIPTFEIIVADDASQDATPEVIGRLGGVVRLDRAKVNAGFLKNCNAAAATAQGQILVFLNNDVLVMPGWLDALIAPLSDPAVGLAGSRLLGPDGRLQEAGGVFWSDGSATNFGRDADATLPEYNYLKDADYLSGASIALNADLWRRLGGFDPLFAPAYCEDADLAFRVREAGLRTVYQPLSSVIHHEGRSHGRDLSSGTKAYQVVNQVKLLDRWKDVLARENLPPGVDVFLARDRSRDKPHILVVDHYIPQWDRDAGSRTVFLYIKMFLDQGFQVTFWPDNLRDDREYGDPLRQMGVEIIAHPSWVGRFPDWVRENGRHLDYALLCRPHVAEKYIDDLRASSKAKLLYYGVDLHHERLRAADALSPDKAIREEADRWEQIERRICARSDVVMYPGNHEAKSVRAWTPAGVAVLDFPITIFSAAEIASARAGLARRATASSHQLLFVGGFAHAPNVSGAVWFVTEVMPRLRRADPRFNLQIVGSNAPQAVMALAQSDVAFLGRVSDDVLDNLYRTSGLAIVPLLFGAGVKGKVIEAMGKGVPIVMTSIGAQGLPGAETFSFVEDDAQAMADAILRAAADPAEAIQRASLALDFIEAKFSSDSVRRCLSPFVPELDRVPGGD